MLNGLVGKKIGMTSVVDERGRRCAVTVVEMGPCVVSQIKTIASDGYDAVQVAYGRRKPSRVTRALRGHFERAGIAPGRVVREFAKVGKEDLKLGQTITVEQVFKPGDLVDVTGISKGRGYAGVIKRHGFGGFPGSRGTHEYFRHGGSIGNRSFPGRVFKGLRMAGHMGSERVTTMKLTVLRVLPEANALVVRGAVPGARGGIVTVKHSSKSRQPETQRTADG